MKEIEIFDTFEIKELEFPSTVRFVFLSDHAKEIAELQERLGFAEKFISEQERADVVIQQLRTQLASLEQKQREAFEWGWARHPDIDDLGKEEIWAAFLSRQSKEGK